jgi:antitoxin HigA-1
LNAKADLSGEMARRFEMAFGLDMDTMMRMQTAYDIAQTRRQAEEVNVERYESAWTGGVNRAKQRGTGKEGET